MTPPTDHFLNVETPRPDHEYTCLRSGKMIFKQNWSEERKKKKTTKKQQYALRDKKNRLHNDWGGEDE